MVLYEPWYAMLMYKIETFYNQSELNLFIDILY